MYPCPFVYAVDENTGELPYELTRRPVHTSVFFPFTSASFSPFAYSDPLGPPPMCKNASGLESKGSAASFFDLHSKYLSSQCQQASTRNVNKTDEPERTSWLSDQDWFGAGDAQVESADELDRCPPFIGAHQDSNMQLDFEKDPMASPVKVEAGGAKASFEVETEAPIVVAERVRRTILKRPSDESMPPRCTKRAWRSSTEPSRAPKKMVTTAYDRPRTRAYSKMLAQQKSHERLAQGAVKCPREDSQCTCISSADLGWTLSVSGLDTDTDMDSDSDSDSLLLTPSTGIAGQARWRRTEASTFARLRGC